VLTIVGGEVGAAASERHSKRTAHDDHEGEPDGNEIVRAFLILAWIRSRESKLLLCLMLGITFGPESVCSKGLPSYNHGYITEATGRMRWRVRLRHRLRVATLNLDSMVTNLFSWMARRAALPWLLTAHLLWGHCLLGQTSQPPKPIEVKVVVIAAFERGEDTGDAPGEFQLWVEREHLDRVFELPAGYHHVRMNNDGVLGMVTGVATAKAAASVMALGLDPRFDVSKAYWIVAGIGGGDPADVSLGSAVWADHVIDGDLAFEIDARQIPESWSTGFVPLRKGVPYEQPLRNDLEGEVYTLNAQLVGWAFGLTRNLALADSDALRKSRARFVGFPNAVRPPFVARGDTMSASTFWHGSKMEEWANAWTKYYTGGTGNYMVAAMEDSGTLQALTFLSRAGRVDLERVLVLRTVSNYDREAPGTTAAESLKSMIFGNYSAYLPALEAAQIVGDRVVRDIVEHWGERVARIPQVQ
jgi:purine nucleoside permease